MGPFPNQKWKNTLRRCDRRAGRVAKGHDRAFPDWAVGLQVVSAAAAAPARVQVDLDLVVAAGRSVRVARGSDRVDSVSRLPLISS